MEVINPKSAIESRSSNNEYSPSKKRSNCTDKAVKEGWRYLLEVDKNWRKVSCPCQVIRAAIPGTPCSTSPTGRFLRQGSQNVVRRRQEKLSTGSGYRQASGTSEPTQTAPYATRFFPLELRLVQKTPAMQTTNESGRTLWTYIFPPNLAPWSTKATVAD